MYEDDGREDHASESAWQAGDLLPGGRYRIVRQIGSWGIRSVYSVADTLTDHPALLCTLASAGTGEVAAHVARLTALEHPFLPVIREYVLRDDQLALVLHVADGTALDDYLRVAPDERLDERTAVDWGIQIAEGLSFLHRQDPPLLVADLAPAALLRTPYARLKLLGLGPLLGLLSPGGLVGALEQGFAAPEVYGGCLTPQSDLYALGALLVHAVTGVHPGTYAPGALPAVRSLRADLTPEFASLLDRAVQLMPEGRWQSAAELGSALREIAATLDERIPGSIAPIEMPAPPAESADVAVPDQTADDPTIHVSSEPANDVLVDGDPPPLAAATAAALPHQLVALPAAAASARPAGLAAAVSSLFRPRRPRPKRA